MKSIIKKDSGKKGKTLAIFCGVHGNEKVGIYAVKKILKNITITQGIVYFVFANPKAIRQNKRFIDKNLNRCFIHNQKGTSYEEKKAKKLMPILDSSDALLDIHTSNSIDTTPFAITDNGHTIVKNMNFEIIATGFDDIEPGATDGYMKHQGKIGICLECGYSIKNNTAIDLAYNSILHFLQYFHAIPQYISNYHLDQKILHVNEIQKVTSKKFTLIKHFKDFEIIPKGCIIAQDEKKQYRAHDEKIILFAGSQKQIGHEAYILGTWVTPLTIN